MKKLSWLNKSTAGLAAVELLITLHDLRRHEIEDIHIHCFSDLDLLSSSARKSCSFFILIMAIDKTSPQCPFSIVSVLVLFC